MTGDPDSVLASHRFEVGAIKNGSEERANLCNRDSGAPPMESITIFLFSNSFKIVKTC